MAEIDTEEAIGEIQVAEYVMLLLAIDTYAGYVEDQTGTDAKDDLTRKGVRLLRMADNQSREVLSDFLTEKVTREESKRQLLRSFRVNMTNRVQAGRRALSVRTALNKGGTTTLNAVFAESRARRAVKTSIAAHLTADPAEALDRYASLPVRNLRIKAWIKEARDVVGSGNSIHNPVEMAAAAVVDHVKTLRNQQVAEEGTTGAEEVRESQDDQTGTMEQLQVEATEAARTAMEVSGEEDLPPTKSEVIGIATAAAAAATAAVGNPNNIPDALKNLDPEQRAAALTDGKVLVAAGAGAGKSTSLVARVKYLVEERKVNPSRILVSSFNKKAADELKHKIGKAIGGEQVADMQVGTLHGVFKAAISKYGNPEEQGMFRGKIGILTGSTTAGAVNRLWRKCFAQPDADGTMRDAETPSAKQMMMHKTKWAGNGVTPAEAKAKATSDNAKIAATWYEMYEGLKGGIPGWRPACEGKAEASREYDNFLKKNRLVQSKDGREYHARLGDFDDMVTVLVGILERSPDVRKRVQKDLDHVIVDEAQDLNSTQSRVLELITEHITDGADGKSFWIVGDPDQSIYAFRGARPDIFTGLDGKEGWKTRLIRTNYRCPPEIVTLANKLIAHNTERMDKEANAAPGRATGEASVLASVHDNEATTAIAVASEIKDSWDGGVPVSDHAILCRTNKEVNAFETGLLMRGIPYARKGASSFLSSPETKAFLGYITLVTDTDTEKAQVALRDILNKPNRFFVSPEQLERAVDSALNNYARKNRQAKKTVDPMVALRDSDFQSDLIFVLKGARTGFKANKGYEQLEILIQALDGLSVITQAEDATTKDMFDAVLDMPGSKFKVNPTSGRIEGETPVSFREELSASIKDFGDEEEDAQEEERPDEMNLGNISFLYELAKPNPEDPGDLEISPQTPKGFWAKMERLTERAKELRIDVNAWEKKQQEFPPHERKPPPGVYLSTAHSTKGAQWPNVYVQMPKGRFPMEPPKKKGEDEEDLSPERLVELEAELEGERRLAYVALTRASKNLRIVAPAQYAGKAAGMSRFLDEAGLVLGENVMKEGSPIDPDPPKTARAFIEDIGDEDMAEGF